jgi:hypothetical protein
MEKKKSFVSSDISCMAVFSFLISVFNNLMPTLTKSVAHKYLQIMLSYSGLQGRKSHKNASNVSNYR